MRAALILICLALSGCAADPEIQCRNRAEPAIKVPVERHGAGYVWRDSNGIGHEIDKHSSSEWDCGPEGGDL